jgi:hypothetical protein
VHSRGHRGASEQHTRNGRLSRAGLPADGPPRRADSLARGVSALDPRVPTGERGSTCRTAELFAAATEAVLHRAAEEERIRRRWGVAADDRGPLHGRVVLQRAGRRRRGVWRHDRLPKSRSALQDQVTNCKNPTLFVVAVVAVDARPSLAAAMDPPSDPHRSSFFGALDSPNHESFAAGPSSSSPLPSPVAPFMRAAVDTRDREPDDYHAEQGGVRPSSFYQVDRRARPVSSATDFRGSTSSQSSGPSTFPPSPLSSCPGPLPRLSATVPLQAMSVPIRGTRHTRSRSTHRRLHLAPSSTTPISSQAPKRRSFRMQRRSSSIAPTPKRPRTRRSASSLPSS